MLTCMSTKFSLPPLILPAGPFACILAPAFQTCFLKTQNTPAQFVSDWSVLLWNRIVSPCGGLRLRGHSILNGLMTSASVQVLELFTMAETRTNRLKKDAGCGIEWLVSSPHTGCDLCFSTQHMMQGSSKSFRVSKCPPRLPGRTSAWGHTGWINVSLPVLLEWH